MQALQQKDVSRIIGFSVKYPQETMSQEELMNFIHAQKLQENTQTLLKQEIIAYKSNQPMDISKKIKKNIKKSQSETDQKQNFKNLNLVETAYLMSYDASLNILCDEASNKQKIELQNQQLVSVMEDQVRKAKVPKRLQNQQQHQIKTYEMQMDDEPNDIVQSNEKDQDSIKQETNELCNVDCKFNRIYKEGDIMIKCDFDGCDAWFHPICVGFVGVVYYFYVN